MDNCSNRRNRLICRTFYNGFNNERLDANCSYCFIVSVVGRSKRMDEKSEEKPADINAARDRENGPNDSGDRIRSIDRGRGRARGRGRGGPPRGGKIQFSVRSLFVYYHGLHQESCSFNLCANSLPFIHQFQSLIKKKLH